MILILSSDATMGSRKMESLSMSSLRVKGGNSGNCDDVADVMSSEVSSSTEGKVEDTCAL